MGSRVQTAMLWLKHGLAAGCHLDPVRSLHETKHIGSVLSGMNPVTPF